MSKYTLFDQQIVFDDSAERFLDMQQALWAARSAAEEEFAQWYHSCNDIATVLKGYPKTATALVVKYANKPLFSQLTDIGIYDISESTYDDECLDYSEIESAFDEIADKYNAIIDEKESAMEYRAERKAGRGRVVGGGFGVGGALKGMATAGAMNAVTGMGHSMVNAVGNAFSALEASAAKRDLYNSNNTLEILVSGIKGDILTAFNAHMNLVNECKEDYIRSSFNSDRAGALFESAKKVSDKRIELLIEAFQVCPWNPNLLVYIFENYPAERKNVWNAAHRVNVDLHEEAEEALSKMYTTKAKQDENAAQEAKSQILSLMTELGIDASATLDTLEQDCIKRILSQYYTSDADARSLLFDKVKQYDAAENNKAAVVHSMGIWELSKHYHVKFSAEEIESILSKVYAGDALNSDSAAQTARSKILEIMSTLGVGESTTLDKLEADCLGRLCPNISAANEDTCNKMLTDIEKYHAREKSKAPFIAQIRQRIEAIWSAEDGEIFDNVYLTTDITDGDAIQQAIQFIESKGRTDSAKAYVAALQACNPKNIKKAIHYQNPTTKKCQIGGWIFTALGVILWVVGLGFLLGAAVCGIGVTLLSYTLGLKAIWNTLTLNGTVVHPTVTVCNSENKKKNGFPVKSRNHTLLILAFVFITALTLIGRRSANEAFNAYVRAYADRDASAIVSLLPKYYINGLIEEGTISSKRELRDLIQEAVDWDIGNLEQRTSENFRHEVTITSENDWSQNIEYTSVLYEYGENRSKVKALREINFFHSATATDGSGEYEELYDSVDIVKIGQSWYVASFPDIQYFY